MLILHSSPLTLHCEIPLSVVKKVGPGEQCCRLMLAALLLLSLDLQKKTRKILSALALFLYHKPFSPQATSLLTFSLYPLYTIHEFLHFVPFLTLFLLQGCPFPASPPKSSSFKVSAQIPPSPRSFPDFSSKKFSLSYVFPRGK